MYISIPPDVKFILDRLQNNYYEAYIVGGCVRDSLLNKEPKDWDITTNALPEEIIRIFPRTIPTGIKHGTISVLINSRAYEVTTFRIDGEYSDNRHPDKVIFSDDIKEDLSRRDFTINAMAYREKCLIDPFSGRYDLDAKLIKCVGNANERFNEDALRMLRAVRFSCQLDFTIEADTLSSIVENNLLISNISAERIRDELCKILSAAKPSAGIRLLMETGLLQYIIPGLNMDLNSMKMLDNIENSLILRLAALLYDTEYASCGTSEMILKNLRFDNETVRKVCILLRENMELYKVRDNVSLKKIISRAGKDNIAPLLKLEAAISANSKAPSGSCSAAQLKDMADRIIKNKEPLNIKDLDINGSDLKNLGYSQGKDLGEALNKLLQIVLEYPELNKKSKLIDIVSHNFIYYK